MVDVFNRLGALVRDGVRRKGDVSRLTSPRDRADARWFYGSQYTHTPEGANWASKLDLCTSSMQGLTIKSPCSIEIELTRRKTPDSCRVSLVHTLNTTRSREVR